MRMRRGRWTASWLAVWIMAGLMAAAFAPTSAMAVTLAVGPDLSVNVEANRHPINPDIYGITFFWSGDATERANQLAFAQAVKLPLNRTGGDGTTRYNWQVDSSNAGSDWFFTAGNGQASPTPGASMDSIVENNRSVGTKTVMTVPIIGHINNASAWHCSFPKSVYGNQQAYNPYIHPGGDDCGNGVNTSGNNIPDTNILAHDKLNDPNIQKAWVQHLVGKYGPGGSGGVQIYQLDNEPSGWLAVHRDVRPNGIGYTELRDRFYSYAGTIKSADPSAKVLGPGDIPYAAYDCNACGNDGKAAHGGVDFGEWILQQMKLYEQNNGVRILDYFTEHYPGCCGGDPITMAQNRITTFRTWINRSYPGTKLGFDEYNWGTGNAFANALNNADGLGLFGREGVDMASYWGLDDVSWPAAYAFKMYRNYDGAGNGFGDTSVQAASSSNALSVYAAQRNRDGALTVMVVNKTASDQTSNLSLSGFNPASTAQVYRYSSANTGAIVRQPDQAVSATGFNATYPANSITLVNIPRTSGASAVGSFHPLPPFRLFDSRLDGSAFVTGETRTLTVVGNPGPNATSTTVGVPAGAKAVVANITAFNVSKGGFLTAYAAGSTLPTVATLNWYKTGQAASNTAIVNLDADGRMNVLVAAASAGVTVDVVGYIDDSATGPTIPAGNPLSGTLSTTALTYHPIPSSASTLRVYDSRSGDGPLITGNTRLIPVTGGVVPSSAKAVAVNVTAINATNNGYLSLYPGTTNLGTASVLFNGAIQRTVGNLAVVPLDSAGKVTVLAGGGSASSDFTMDVLGYYDATSLTTGRYASLTPVRLYDSRSGSGPLNGAGSVFTTAVSTKPGGGTTGVPSTAKAVIVHLTAANTVNNGYLALYGQSWQNQANINWTGNNVLVSNLAVVNLEGLDSLKVRLGGGSGVKSDFILDIVGYVP